MSILNFAGYFSLFLVILQIINQIIILYSSIKANIFTIKYFSWREVNRFVEKIAKRIQEDNIEHGMICGTGRGGGILAALLSYKLRLVPVLVLDRKYIIDDIKHERASLCIEQKVILDSQFQNLLKKPVLLITSRSDPGVTLLFVKRTMTFLWRGFVLQFN